MIPWGQSVLKQANDERPSEERDLAARVRRPVVDDNYSIISSEPNPKPSEEEQEASRKSFVAKVRPHVGENGSHFNSAKSAEKYGHFVPADDKKFT